jgi:glycosyltransferase involved in cell wall biosynthesis
MHSPRVLFVNHTSAISGAEKVLLNVVSSRPNSSIFLFEDGELNESMLDRGVNVIKSRFGGGLARLKRDASLLRAAPLAGRLSALSAELCLAARRHDVIYTNSQKAFVLGAIAAAVTRRPLIWHLHDIISASHFGVAQRRLQVSLANRFAKTVIGPSGAVTTEFIARGGRADLAQVVHNGFDMPAETTPRAALRGELGLPSGPLVGVFSRLAPWKGQHVVLRALSQIPNVRCVVAGDALFGEEAYAESLRGLAANLGIANRVIFLGQRADAPRLMRAVDIVIHSSVLPEPFATTLLEAMMAPTPIIATDNGGSSEALAAGGVGTLVPPGDSAALAQAIRAILAGPSGLDAEIKKGAERARREYGVEKMLHAISKVIDSAATGARR